MKQSKVETLLVGDCKNIKQLEYVSRGNSYKPTWFNVSKVITISELEYTKFTEFFLMDYKWLEGIEGVVVVTDGKRSIAVGSQPYNYVRYTGIIKQRVRWY
jgi:hypothetical protein